MKMAEITQSWEALILRHSKEAKYKSRTCSIFNNKVRFPTEPDKLCPCGRLVRRHSFNGESLESKAAAAADRNATWAPPEVFLDNSTHSAKVPINVFGTSKPLGCKFLRIDSRTKFGDIFQLLVEDCGKQKPVLILSIYGGAKYFTMTDRLEKEFIRGIVDAATMADAWIFTAGINNGVSKLVGEGISHYRLLRDYPKEVKCIGMTMWGTINENTRLELKNTSQGDSPVLCKRQIPENLQQDKETIEPNHTHCILFDSGRLNEYLSDSHRSNLVKEACTIENHTCYAVTLIVEGGLGSLEVLENDIIEKQPIVLIQGSGRLADVLAILVEQTSNPDRNQQWDPSDEEIVKALDRFCPNISSSEVSSATKRIKKVLNKDHRYLLHVFSLDRDKNVAETIFKAIFIVTNMKKKEEDEKKKAESDKKIQNEKNEEEKKRLEDQENQRLKDKEEQRRKDEDKLVDLALEWNYFDGVVPILQARQNEMIKKNSDFIKLHVIRQKELFLKSLEKNRPKFIEYFLSAGFDPLTLADTENLHTYQKKIVNLYTKSHEEMNTSHKDRVRKLFGKFPFKSIKHLDYQLNKIVGSFFGSIYSLKDDSFQNRFKIDLSNRCCGCCEIDSIANHQNEKSVLLENKYTKHHMLRDLFLWSIFMDMPEMAKVLLLHVRSRICAALIASAIFKRYSESSQTVDLKDKFRIQALEFETYAGKCIDKCYEYNEKRACELLLRQIELFGNVTCMQVAISSESRKLLETACFDQTLNQVWYNKLSLNNHSTASKLVQVPAIFTLGFVSPWVITYREEENESLNKTNVEALSREGINYYIDEQKDDNDGDEQRLKKEDRFKKYWTRFLYFHESPMVKMCYHFLSYVWFLLAFSYMMLYHLDGRNDFVIPHWTEIYVIITVSTMFCEEVRKLHHEYNTRMIERWGSTGSTVVTVMSNVFYILPYFLFYLGLGFRYGSYNDALLSTARIVWALDLELWYLRSLKFVIALKFLGPKLFMLKNMLRDLFAFVYMIFIAIAAYGVVSRALIFYKQIPFTGRGIFGEIFYEPYWFIYGEVSDKDLLDAIISNNTAGGEAEATATHVLLAFHMLFINILLLNLLIAVFADSIGKVQENTEFYWRYQRYSFVREYFERLPLSYPPLIIIPHMILIVLAIRSKCCPKLCRNRVRDENDVSTFKSIVPIFKMIPIKNSQNEQWDLFENAATHSYARSVLEKYKNKDSVSTDDGKPTRTLTSIDSDVSKTTVDQQQAMANFKEELMTTFKSVLTETQKGLEQNNSRMENRLDQITTSLGWMMNAIERVKMNDPKHPRPALELPPLNSDVQLSNRVTTNSIQ